MNERESGRVGTIGLLVVSQLVQCGAGGSRAVKAVLFRDAADSCHIQQLAVLLAFPLGDKDGANVLFRI